MMRITTPVRPGWPKIVESQGLTYHSLDGQPYWDEGAYYLFEAHEIDAIEAATERLNAMCLEAVDHVIRSGRLGEFDIPEPFHDLVERSWDRDEHTIYGRFDLSYDGDGPPKLLEYNADTPTALLEAAVIQWFWSRDLLSGLEGSNRAGFDQFNSLHERLIEAWGRVRRELGRKVVFAAVESSPEDVMTVTYLRDTATQAGLRTEFVPVDGIGWHAGRRVFTDRREGAIEILFKLYPWEWMVREEFGAHLPVGPTRWLEPPWKMVLSNKAILPVLWELFPESPYLLRADFAPIGETYVAKPILSREGANVTIVRDGRPIAWSEGEYGDGRHVYQEYRPLPDFGGHRPVVGSWIVNGHACGLGIREDSGPITRNTSRFVPHLFRLSADAKPPIMGPSPHAGRVGGLSAAEGDPLWDDWLDR